MNLQAEFGTIVPHEAVSSSIAPLKVIAVNFLLRKYRSKNLTILHSWTGDGGTSHAIDLCLFVPCFPAFFNFADITWSIGTHNITLV